MTLTSGKKQIKYKVIYILYNTKLLISSVIYIYVYVGLIISVPDITIDDTLPWDAIGRWNLVIREG